MNFPSPILRWLLIVCLSACPELVHGEESIEELRKKAEQGDAKAQFKLGITPYATESENVINKNKGLEWLIKAAEQGLPEAQSFLAAIYVFGDGVEQNMIEALKWNRKAAEQGFAKAQQQMGRFYANGHVVAKNDVIAYMWYLLAKANGDEAAIEDTKIIENMLSIEQRAEGQRLATEWQAAFEKKQNVK